MLAARLQPCLCRCVGRNRELLYGPGAPRRTRLPHRHPVLRMQGLGDAKQRWAHTSSQTLPAFQACKCSWMCMWPSSHKSAAAWELLLHLTFGGLLQEAGPLRSCTPLPLHGVEIQVLQAALAATVRMACPLRPVPLPSRPASLVARTPLNQRPLHS